MNDLQFGWWFAGFVDGEGCFTWRKKGKSVQPQFAINMRADQLSILEMCQERFTVGNIYHNKPQVSVNIKGKVAHSKPQVMWQVRRKSDLLRLVSHFDKFPPQASKKSEYYIWRELVLEYSKHRNLKDHNRINVLAKVLTDAKAYNPDDAPIVIPVREWEQLNLDRLDGGD